MADTNNKDSDDDALAGGARRQRDDAVSVADDEGHVDEAGDVSCVSTGGDDVVDAVPHVPRSSKSSKEKTSGTHHRVSDAVALTNDDKSATAGKRRGSADKVADTSMQQKQSPPSVANE